MKDFFKKWLLEINLSFVVLIVILNFSSLLTAVIREEQIKDILFLIIEIIIPTSVGFLFILGFLFSYRMQLIEEIFNFFLDTKNKAYRLSYYLSRIFGWMNVLGKNAQESWDILVAKLRVDDNNQSPFSGYEERFNFNDERAEIGAFKIAVKKLFRIKETFKKFLITITLLFFISIVSVFIQNYIILLLTIYIFLWFLFYSLRLVWLFLFEERKEPPPTT